MKNVNEKRFKLDRLQIKLNIDDILYYTSYANRKFCPVVPTLPEFYTICNKHVNKKNDDDQPVCFFSFYGK